MSKLPDEKIMSLVKSGDQTAMTELVNRYRNKLLNYFYRMSSDRDFAEDLVQDCFTRVYKYRFNYDEEKSLFSWIFQISKNVWNTEYRRQQKRVDFQTENIDINHIKEFTNTTPIYDQQEIVQKALLKLNESDREIIILYHLEGFKYSELSIILKVDEGVLRVKICRALKKLGIILKRLGYEHK